MKRFIFIIILLFLLIFLLRGENIFYTVLKPTQKALYKSGEKTLTEEDFCRQLKIENVKLRMIQTENEILKQHLNFLSGSKDNFVLANVIGRKTEAGVVWFLLDQGAEQGIRQNLAVVDENGILLGTIVKVEKNFSYLRPIFDRRSSLTADVISQESLKGINGADKPEIISGIIQGEYGSNLKMKYIPLDKEIKIGDGVITTGQEEGIRWGIIIGQVAEINKKPNAVFQEVLVRPLFQTNFRIAAVILSP